LGSLARVDVELGETEFPALSDGTQARRAEVTVTVVLGISTKVIVDIVTVRSGRMMGVMIYSNFLSLDEVEEQMIARTMSAKLDAADATLPE
jgi:hypothetical protein